MPESKIEIMETKFRAWDKKNKKWIGKSHLEYLCVNDYVVVLVKYAPNNSGGYDPIECKQLTNPEVDNLEIVQFTGLKDKNGVEIYKGFICKNGDWESDANAFNYRTEEIVWDIDNGMWLGWNHNMDGMTCEVIGNIYENPELTNRSK